MRKSEGVLKNVNRPKSMLGFNATGSMAVGGMIGGGIFSAPGVAKYDHRLNMTLF